MSSAYNESRYLQLKERIEKTEMDVAKSRRLILIILQQLEPYYQCLLTLESMEPFAKLKGFCEYVKSHINGIEPDVLEEYILLCNETGQIVGEGEESELFSEEDILLMREKYYTEIHTLSDEHKLVSDYGYCIFGSLYYIISFFQFSTEDADKMKKRVEKLVSYIFEDMLLDFNEELYGLSNISFIDSTVDLLMKEL